MDTNDPIERAEVLGQAAIKEMARLGVAATPENYLIWYTHAAGRDPELSTALKDLERDLEPITSIRCHELYERFFSRAPICETIRAAACEARWPDCFHDRPLVMP